MRCYIMIVFGALLSSYSPLAVDPSHGEVSPNERGQTIKDRYEAVARRLDAIGGALEFDSIAQIGEDVNSLPLVPKEDPEWRNWRRVKLELWLRTLDLIDGTKDPAFKPDDVPFENIAPPPAAGAEAGVSPSAIKDPKLRHEYEQAIKRNQEKAKRHLLQTEIPRLDRQWTESVKVYISGQYTTEPQDVNEIRTLIDRRLALDSRKQQIRNFMRQERGN